MPEPTTKIEWIIVLAAAALVLGWRWSSAPDWYGIIRVAMMGLGGLVVLVLVLIVMVAVVSGLAGMIGKLKKRS